MLPNGALTTIILLLVTFHTFEAKKVKKNGSATCPTGFKLTYTKEEGDPICYRLKGPEKFSDKFVDCVGNLFTWELFADLALAPHNVKIWSDYKTLYPGGPFIDWSFAESTGNVLTTTFRVEYNAEQGINDEFCTVFEPHKSLLAVKCSEKYHRYCFVKPYEYSDLKECDSTPNYIRFWSPRASCLRGARGVGGSVIRATWRQAKDLCAREGTSLMQRGWRYANYPGLHLSNASETWSEPLGLIMTPGEKLLWLDSDEGNRTVESSEWNFRSESTFPVNSSLVALVGDEWQLVDSAHVFYDVICEKPVHLPRVNLTIRNEDGQLLLTVNELSVDEDDIWCYSDSVIFYPSRVKVFRARSPNEYLLSPITEGYYWCIVSDSLNYTVSESNKELYIRDASALENLYAIKIKTRRKYNFENLDKLSKIWSKRLSEYLYLRTHYLQQYGQFKTQDLKEIEDILKKYKHENGGWSDDDDVVLYQKIKRVYLDRKTVLLHALISSEMTPSTPGLWEDMEIIYMRPTYHCKGFDNVLTTHLGAQVTVDGCKTYSCTGDFNEGVQWVESEAAECARAGGGELRGGVTRLIPTVEDPPSREASQTVPSTVQYLLKQLANRNDTNEDTSSTEEYFSTPLLPNEPSPLPSSKRPPPKTTTSSEEVTTVTMPYYSTTSGPPTVDLPTTTPSSPENQVMEVLDHLEQILHNDSVPVNVQVIDEAFDQVDEILNFSEEVDIPGELLQLLDQLGARADLNGSQMGSSIRSNVALLIADAKPETPVRGLRIATRAEEAFTDDAFELLSDEANSTQLEAEASEAVVQLPESLARSERRISFVVFRTDRAFQLVAGSHHYTVNSRILSINVENVTEFDEGEVIEMYLRPIVGELQRNEKRACAYWHFYENGTGTWSQEGCTFVAAAQPGMLDTCRCTHLTHFAEVLAPRAVFSERNENALEIISLIGCYVSLFGLICIGLTAALFRVWRRDFTNKVWLQLCAAIFVLIVCFLVVVYARFETYNVPCMLVGVALHYAVLASFCWMLVAAVLSYRRLVLVFNQDVSHKLLRASAFAWGLPCAVVGVLLSVDPHSYAGRFDDMTPSAGFCYPSGLGLWLALYSPVALMLLANWTLFGFIVYSVFASRRVQRHGGTNEVLRCATVSCLLVFLFGLPWIFGLFASNVVFAYLFTLTATFQGFVLFLFFVVGNKKTRDMWLNKLRIVQKRKVPVTSSTYKSSGRAAGSSSTAVSKAQYVKPRALVVSDDSGFS